MADVFIEHLISKRLTIKDYLLRIIYIIAYVLLVMIFMFVNQLSSMLIFAVAGGGWLFFWLIKNQTIEYEYSFTNGELDIDCIKGKSNRKRIMTLNCKDFEILANISHDSYSEYKDMTFAQKLDVSSGNSSKTFFAVCPHAKGGKLLFLFEPNEKILTALQNYIPRQIKL